MPESVRFALYLAALGAAVLVGAAVIERLASGARAANPL